MVEIITLCIKNICQRTYCHRKTFFFFLNNHGSFEKFCQFYNRTLIFYIMKI